MVIVGIVLEMLFFGFDSDDGMMIWMFMEDIKSRFYLIIGFMI